MFFVYEKNKDGLSKTQTGNNVINKRYNNKNWIKHKIYGKGKIVKVEKTSLMVDFRMVGKKKIGMEWCLKNCEVLK